MSGGSGGGNNGGGNNGGNKEGFFANPTYYNDPIGVCATSNDGCGQQSADMACRGFGFSRATSFGMSDVPPGTRVAIQGENRWCTACMKVIVNLACRKD